LRGEPPRRPTRRSAALGRTAVLRTAVVLALAIAAIAALATSAAQAQTARAAQTQAAGSATCVIRSLPSFTAQGEGALMATVADIVEVECDPMIYGTGSKITITATQLYERCGKDVSWYVPNPFSVVAGKGVSVALDADGNATVALIAGPNCQAGESLVSAHMEETPFETFTTDFTVLAPGTTPQGLFAMPSAQVEDALSSGAATIVEAEFNEGSEKTLRVASEELYDRCRIAPHLHWIKIDRSETTGPEVTGVPLDNDGNGFVIAVGDESCAPGRSLIEGDLEQKPFSTETAEFTILPPQPTAEPSFTIEKAQEIAGSGDGFTTTPLQASLGQTVDYQITVRNNAKVSETFSEFADAHCDPGTIAGGPGSSPVPPGQATVYTCHHLLTEVGSYTNQAQVTGNSVGGNPLTLSSNQVVVEVPPKPGFKIEKVQRIAGSGEGFTGSPLSGTIGQTVEYEIVVTNTGNVPLTFTGFSDPRCDAGTIAGGPGGLPVAPGASTTYTCSHVITSTGTYVNEASVTGTSPGSSPLALTSNPVEVSAAKSESHSTPQSTTEQAPVAGPGVPQPTGGQAGFKCFAPPTLHGATGLKRAPFTLSISSAGIKQIMFYLDGREIKVLKQSQAKGGKFTLKIDPRKLSYGPHKLTVKTFMSNRSCARIARKGVFVRPHSERVEPKFTG
jgi:hypothetical protein